MNVVIARPVVGRKRSRIVVRLRLVVPLPEQQRLGAAMGAITDDEVSSPAMKVRVDVGCGPFAAVRAVVADLTEKGSWLLTRAFPAVIPDVLAVVQPVLVANSLVFSSRSNLPRLVGLEV